MAKEQEAEEETHVPAHTPRKGGRKPLPENLPRIDGIHDIAPAEKTCACGCALNRKGEEVSEQLDIVPAQARVIRHINCWAHSRRKFMDMAKVQGKNHKVGSADMALKYIDQGTLPYRTGGHEAELFTGKDP